MFGNSRTILERDESPFHLLSEICYSLPGTEMYLFQITILALVGLLSGQIQCMITCTGELCDSIESHASQNLPPCHRQHNNPARPATCQHQSISPVGLSPTVAHNLNSPASSRVPSVPVSSFQARLMPEQFGALVRSSSPPPLSGFSSSVLRI